MFLSVSKKNEISKEMVNELSKFEEVKKIVIFGSFFNNDSPEDIDIAVFQDSSNEYLELALKYRKSIRNIANRISVDLIPVKNNSEGYFLNEINKGQVVFERGN